MSFLRRPFSRRTPETNHEDNSGHESDVTDGSLHYVVEKAGNDSGLSYQEATGAPVETSSPLGYSVGPITIIFLNISKMIGTGVYSTRKLPPKTAYSVAELTGVKLLRSSRAPAP